MGRLPVLIKLLQLPRRSNSPLKPLHCRHLLLRLLSKPTDQSDVPLLLWEGHHQLRGASLFVLKCLLFLSHCWSSSFIENGVTSKLINRSQVEAQLPLCSLVRSVIKAGRLKDKPRFRTTRHGSVGAAVDHSPATAAPTLPMTIFWSFDFFLLNLYLARQAVRNRFFFANAA